MGGFLGLSYTGLPWSLLVAALSVGSDFSRLDEHTFSPCLPIWDPIFLSDGVGLPFRLMQCKANKYTDSVMTKIKTYPHLEKNDALPRQGSSHFSSNILGDVNAAPVVSGPAALS